MMRQMYVRKVHSYIVKHLFYDPYSTSFLHEQKRGCINLEKQVLSIRFARTV